MNPAILTDITKCIGCRECVAACKVVNDTQADSPRRWSLDDGLSSDNWTSIVEREGEFVRKQCRHCLEPACVSACPVAALHVTEIGTVVYDSDKCLGCRYCMMACAYGIPRYDWDKAVPYVRKCILCHDRLMDGQQPACTEVCPTQATIFGNRDELIAEAKKRIAADPDKYDNHVWGEHEVGGTRILYLVPKNFDLSFMTYGQKLGEKALPQVTAPAMHAVPFAFLGMGGLMAGVHWIVKRRIELSKTDQDASKEEGGEHEQGA
ncbi:4Fe-4S dicluster domain-containing protein [bacterium]|nr:4Fe-4S dicluster domain-containing protein [bacterium]